MSDWFDDPFYRDDGNMDPGNMFADFDRSFNQVHQHMQRMMENAFKGFGVFDDDVKPIEHDKKHRSGLTYDDPKPAPKTSSKRKLGEPIIEEPDDDDVYHVDTRSQRRSGKEYGEPPKTYYYSSTTTAFSGPDGVTQVRRKTHDSNSGESHYSEMRQIGDKSVLYERKIGRDGKAVDKETRHNVYDEDVDKFNQDWESHKRSLPSLGHLHHDRDSHHHHSRALK